MAVTSENGDRNEDTEERLSRVVDRLFPGTLQEASSSSSVPTRTSSAGALQNLSPFVLGGSSESNNVLPLGQCSPWGRADLLKRVVTFKSVTWFGKPKIVDPVACARRGWVNSGLDLIACEFCGSRLSFSIPVNWPKHQVDKAALEFSEKLVNGHKSSCLWRGIVCPESMAGFPSMAHSELVKDYNGRMESLSRLSALPRISPSAVQHMQLSRSSQVEFLFSWDLFEDTDEEAVSAIRDNYKSYCQAQKLISLCGWNMKILPYVVDSREERVARSGSERDAVDCGPKVFLSPEKLTDAVSSSKGADPASAVLECGLCGASVGLWSFTTVSRSALAVRELLATIRASSKKKTPIVEVAASEPAGTTAVDDENMRPQGTTGLNEPEKVEQENEADKDEKEVVTASEGLDLGLTIAGGPRPTRLAYPTGVFPAYIPIPGLLRQVDVEANVALEHPLLKEAEGEQVTPRHRKRKGDGITEGREKRRTWKGSFVGTSSVNAVLESTYHNKCENSAETVECSPDEVLSKETNDTSSALVLGVSSKEFDPVHQHRYFCPWVSSNLEGARCGWHLTIDALQAENLQQKSGVEESASLKLDPMGSLRKIFGGAVTPQRA